MVKGGACVGGGARLVSGGKYAVLARGQGGREADIARVAWLVLALIPHHCSHLFATDLGEALRDPDLRLPQLARHLPAAMTVMINDRPTEMDPFI